MTAEPARELRWSRDGIDFVGHVHHADHERFRLFLIHGLGEHSARYEEFIAFFVQRGVSVARFDLRGHGRTAGKRGHAPGLAALHDDFERFRAVAAAAFEGSPTVPIVIYGHSFGGLLALDYALRREPRDVDAVVASAPALRPGSAPPRWKVALGRALRPWVPSFTMSNGVDRHGLTSNPDVVAGYGSDPLVHGRISVRLGLDVLEAGEALLASDWAPRMRVLVMHGAADTVTSPAASAAFVSRCARAEFELWPDLEHELHHETASETVLAFVHAWITGERGVSPTP